MNTYPLPWRVKTERSMRSSALVVDANNRWVCRAKTLDLAALIVELVNAYRPVMKMEHVKP